MSDLKSDLQAARSFVEKGWHQGKSAATVDGIRVATAHAKATHFCMMAAVTRVCENATDRYFAAHDALKETIGSNVIDFNDAEGRTHEEVLAIFDRTIAAIS